MLKINNVRPIELLLCGVGRGNSVVRLRLALSVGEFGKRLTNQLTKAAMKNRSTILYSSAPIAANRLLVFVFFSCGAF